MERLLIDIAVKGSLVLIAGWGLARALEGRSAAVRHLVWSATLGALAALPLLSVALPEWRLAVLPAEPMAAAAASSTSITAAPSEGIAWSRLAAFAWLAGALAVTVVTVAGRIRLAWLTRGCEDLEHGPWPALANRIAGEVGLGRAVRLRMVDRAMMPMVWGVVRPVVLLPSTAESWSAPLRRHVLLHELAHVKRYDCLVQIVARVALAIHWFNPLAWIAARRLRLERERACDDHVLGCGADACDYAEDLVEMARRLTPSRGVALALGMADPSRFGDRVMALLSSDVRRRDLTRRATLMACALAAAVVIPLAVVRPAPSVPGVEEVERIDSSRHGASPAVSPRRVSGSAVATRSARGSETATPAASAAKAREPGARPVPTVRVAPIEVTLKRRGSARGLVEANTTRGIPRAGISRVEYRRTSGAGEAPGRWTSTPTKASDACEEERRGAPARPAQLASTTLDLATP
ncbi:MAG: M56 family metallopeptidase [Gemmatimonadota bacterium]|nr:M56 family metallopeptidase [Gemmatimonadota bacterium]